MFRLFKKKHAHLTNKQEIIDFIKQTKEHIFGIGIHSFNRHYLRDLGAQYQILSLFSAKRDVPHTQAYPHGLEGESAGITGFAKYRKNSYAVLTLAPVKERLSKFKRPFIISYNNTRALQSLARKRDYRIMLSDCDISERLRNKKEFRAFLEKHNLQDFLPRYVEVNPDDLVYERIVERLGAEQFVLQFSDSDGGKGTFMIASDADLANIRAIVAEHKAAGEVDEIIASEFVTGASASISAVATRWGTFASNAQAQVHDIPELKQIPNAFGLFSGHDWSYATTHFSPSVHEQARAFTMQFGDILYKMGYQGFFGVDLIISDDGCKVIECNPRLTGVMPILDMIQAKNDSIEFMMLHVLEYLADEHPCTLDVEAIRRALAVEERYGSHVLISSEQAHNINITTDLLEGTYRLDGKDVVYVDARNHLADIGEDEFIIAEVPSVNYTVNKYERICRIAFPGAVLNESGKNLNEHAKTIVKSVRAKLTISPSTVASPKS